MGSGLRSSLIYGNTLFAKYISQQILTRFVCNKNKSQRTIRFALKSEITLLSVGDQNLLKYCSGVDPKPQIHTQLYSYCYCL